MLRRLIALVVVLVGSAALPGLASANSPVPPGFVGAMVDGPMLGPEVNLSDQLAAMEASGVESIRVPFDWATAQPYASWQNVPSDQIGVLSNGPGDRPTDFRATDRLVEAAARRGLRVLPTVLYAPSWDVVSTGSRVEPRDPEPFGQYVTALVERYGPGGSFWSDNPSLPAMPIRQWQIWNEPSLAYYWTTQPFTRTYVPLLRAAHDALRLADPGAQIVLAGMPNYSWSSLEEIYRAGAGRLFDVVSVHPYTASPWGVLKILSIVRGVMRHNGDPRKPMLATEVGWPSSLGRTRETFGIATTPQGQAKRLRILLPQLGRQRLRLGLEGFYLYTWMGDERRGGSPFSYSGLFRWDAARRRAVVKPAFNVFRVAALALEDCRVKGTQASLCAVPGR